MFALQLLTPPLCSPEQHQDASYWPLSKSKVVTDSTLFGRSTTKVVHTIEEWFWKLDAHWELRAYAGSAPEAEADDAARAAKSAAVSL